MGSLLYASIGTRPDITFVIGNVARFSSNPTRRHWTGLSEVLDTCDLGLHCTRDVDDLTGYSDSDWT